MLAVLLGRYFEIASFPNQQRSINQLSQPSLEIELGHALSLFSLLNYPPPSIASFSGSIVLITMLIFPQLSTAFSKVLKRQHTTHLDLLIRNLNLVVTI